MEAKALVKPGGGAQIINLQQAITVASPANLLSALVTFPLPVKEGEILFFHSLYDPHKTDQAMYLAHCIRQQVNPFLAQVILSESRSQGSGTEYSLQGSAWVCARAPHTYHRLVQQVFMQPKPGRTILRFQGKPSDQTVLADLLTQDYQSFQGELFCDISSTTLNPSKSIDFHTDPVPQITIPIRNYGQSDSVLTENNNALDNWIKEVTAKYERKT